MVFNFQGYEIPVHPRTRRWVPFGPGGGMSHIFKARDLGTGQFVILKFLHPQLLDDKVARARFKQEAELLAKLRHPAIPQIYRHVDQNERAYIAMQFLEGVDLYQKVKIDGPLDLESWLFVVDYIVSALALLHSRGIIHRDIKPANIQLTLTGVSLLDFGSARANLGLTANGEDIVPFSPLFGSPEQFIGSEVGVETDFYSLGSTSWYLLTGRAPFECETRAALKDAHLHRQLDYSVLPSSAFPAASLLSKLMAKAPSARPSAAAIQEELSAIRRFVAYSGSVASPFASFEELKWDAITKISIVQGLPSVEFLRGGMRFRWQRMAGGCVLLGGAGEVSDEVLHTLLRLCDDVRKA